MNDESPVRQRRARARFWIRLGAIALAVILLGSFLVRKYSADIVARLQSELSIAFGREVTIAGGTLTRRLYLTEVRVAGDGNIDTGSFMILEGIAIHPSYPSLLIGNPRVTLVTVETATISVVYDPARGWSLRGLFPKRPPRETSIDRIEMPNAILRLTSNDQTITHVTAMAFDLDDFGEYRVVFRDTRAQGEIAYTGPSAERPLYTMNVLFDSVLIMGLRETVSVATTYQEDSKIVSFDIATALKGIPTSMAGSLTFDSTFVRTDSANWTFGEYAGTLDARVDDFEKKRVTISSAGTIAFDAPKVSPRFARGRIFVDKIFVAGGLEGAWDLRGDFRADGLTLNEPALIENLSGGAVLAASLSESFRFSPAHARGSVRFAKAVLGEETLRDGDVDFSFDGERAEISGSLGALGGRLSSKKLTVTFADGFDARSIRGALSAANIAIPVAAMIKTLSADLSQFSAVKTRKRWEIREVTGRVKDAVGQYAGAALRVTGADIDLSFDAAERASGKFDGGIGIFGGRGTLRGTILSNTIQTASMNLKGLEISSIRRVKETEFWKKAAEHMSSLDVEGEICLEDEGRAFYFDGRIGSPNFHLRPGGARGYPAVLTIAAAAPFEKFENARLDKFVLDLEKGKTRLAVAQTQLTDWQFAARITVDRLDADHARGALAILRPIPEFDKLKLAGSLSGKINLEKRDAIVSEIDVTGDMELQDEPFKFHAQGRLADDDPQLIVEIETVGTNALHASLADVNPAVDKAAMAWSGKAGATLTLVGEDWGDINIEGVLRLRGASVRFPEYEIDAKGMTGELPFRLQKARLLELDPVQARPMKVERLEWKDLFAENIRMKSRFSVHPERPDEKTIYFNEMAFRFAEGKGEGFGAIHFETWDHPKFAFGGKIDGCSVGIVYRTMQPFKGVLDGTGAGKIEITTDRGEIQRLEADFRIKDGFIGSELLTQIIQTQQQEGEKPSLQMQALKELSQWHFRDANISLKHYPRYYDEQVARNKFGSPAVHETIGNIEIAGPIRPTIEVVGGINPLSFISVMVRLQIQEMPMRLFMDRVGKRLQ